MKTKYDRRQLDGINRQNSKKHDIFFVVSLKCLTFVKHFSETTCFSDNKHLNRLPIEAHLLNKND